MIPKWKEDAQKNNLLSDKLINWFDFIEDSLEKTALELNEIMTTGKESGKRLVAALVLSVKHKISPNDVFYAHIFLFNYVSQLIWGTAIEVFLENIVSHIWTSIANSQLFALLSPKITAAQILGACSDSSGGFRKVAKILLAARNSVSLRIPEKVITLLIRFAAS